LKFTHDKKKKSKVMFKYILLLFVYIIVLAQAVSVPSNYKSCIEISKDFNEYKDCILKNGFQTVCNAPCAQ
jgi:hypothetical protein